MVTSSHTMCGPLIIVKQRSPQPTQLSHCFLLFDTGLVDFYVDSAHANFKDEAYAFT